MRAETIAKALGGRKVVSSWMAGCATHDDRNPSLSIRDGSDGKVLVWCHAGCDQARVIDALRARGLWEDNGRRNGRIIHPEPRRAANDQPDRDNAKRMELAFDSGGAICGPWRSRKPQECRVFARRRRSGAAKV